MSKSIKPLIIDYGLGNLWSVKNAINFLGYDVVISSDPEKIINANKILLPGVGSFAMGMKMLKKLDLDEAIRVSVVENGNSILGICLGMQLLGKSSREDGYTEGLGLIPADVDIFNKAFTKDLKIPHIGFNRVYIKEGTILYKDLNEHSDFYFVHSYRMLPNKIETDCQICMYGEKFAASYEKDNIFATQFHPEKSQTNGLILLNNFLES